MDKNMKLKVNRNKSIMNGRKKKKIRYNLLKTLMKTITAPESTFGIS